MDRPKNGPYRCYSASLQITRDKLWKQPGALSDALCKDDAAEVNARQSRTDAQQKDRHTERERERERDKTTHDHPPSLPPSLAILGSDPGFAKHYTGELGKHAAQRFGRIFFLQPSHTCPPRHY